MAKKKTKQELVKEWIKKHDICGDEPWWDKSNTYYNLTASQIISIAAHLQKNSNVNEAF